MPATTSNGDSPRTRLMTVAAEILVTIYGEPPASIFVTILGLIRECPMRLKFASEPGEPTVLLGWGARLTDEDIAILKVLADAEEPLLGKGIARELELDDDDSPTLRLRLAPKGQLRGGGYITHLANEGYTITEKGRNALEGR